MNLRQITIKDQLELKKVYFDSIQSLDEKIYSQEQKRAWSSQAWNNPNFDKSIIKGKGWLIIKQGIILLLRQDILPIELLYFTVKVNSKEKVWVLSYFVN